MSREDLIRRARAGDGAALGELLALHRGDLRDLADLGLPARLKAMVDASDVVQQTCLSAFRQISELQGDDPAAFAGWLRRMHENNIRNAVRDQLRTRKRRDGREERLAGRDVGEADGATPSRHAMRREDSGRLAEALGRLPDDEREAVRLRFLEGRTLAEVGDALGLTRDAVAWLLQKGMRRLKPWLPRDGGEAG